MRHNYLARFALIFLAACGSDSTSTTNNTEDDTGIVVNDAGQDTSTSDQSNGVAEYSVCVLGASSATRGPCPNSDEVVDFGTVAPGEEVARLVRVRNDGALNLTVQNVEVTTQRAELFALEFFRVANDGAVTELDEPFNIPTDGYIFVRVRFTGDPPDSPIPAEYLTADVDIATGGSLTIEVPLVGDVGSCAQGTADCNPLTIGCETDTLNDAANCGGCGVSFACGAGNLCMNGSCAIATCPASLSDCDGVFANGCETSISSDANNCGGCGTTTASGTPNPNFICPGPDALNAESICVNKTCEMGDCLDGYADCTGDLGCETDINTIDNCGGCGNLPGNAGRVFRCEELYPNTEVTCESMGCVPGDCKPGWVDLDGQNFVGGNGCEYACGGDPANVDVPDENAPFIDANCDGIDGDISGAIFVATFGNDSNAGTPTAPKRTLQNAINTALLGNKDVYVANGSYSGPTLQISNGVSIFGGFNSDWSRSAVATATYVQDGTVSNARMVGALGNNITQVTIIDRIRIQTPNATGTGVSNYGLHCTNCSGLLLRNSEITAGAGSNGQAGTNGVFGRVGGDGFPGGAVNNGACSDNGCGPAGGDGGTSVAGRPGGKGGAGGNSGGTTGGCGGATNGVAGLTGQQAGAGGGAGGPGGAKGDGGRDGGDGGDGLPGSAGGNGDAGAFAWVGGFFVATHGTSGANGTNGHGGGGGGGGGAHSCTLCDNGRGNGGGGGGGGGERGVGGTGGENGGSSFGLVLVNSTGATIVNNTIRASSGGRGGDGGTGGIGGNGGAGGIGPDPCASKGGAGGDGGNGGEGGDGGHGGGGRGGYSYSVVLQGTTATLFTNTMSFGSAGAGGISPGVSGQPGLAGQTL